jgi:hypothetical protein
MLHGMSPTVRVQSHDTTTIIGTALLRIDEIHLEIKPIPVMDTGE